MLASVRWLNRYLAPSDLTADQAEHALTDAGFPIESRETLPSGDTRLDVEITSNRGDCLSIIGLAREIAAKTGRTLKLPDLTAPKPGDEVRSQLTLDNQVPDLCPRFTVHVITGVKVGPSPAWLRELLESVGQRSINNVVDITNFLNFEHGQPCHAFDLAKLACHGSPSSVARALPSLIVRLAQKGESLTTLDGKKRMLNPDEVVVADAQRAQSLAGVIGGADSEVSGSTTDVVLEVATWSPVAVRRAARRHQIKTDASHRFERFVDPRTLDAPAHRAATLIAEIARGTLCAGMLESSSGPPAPLREVRLRPDRARALLGINLHGSEMAQLLGHLGIAVRATPGADAMLATIPPWRHDLEREVDLIEEVGRIKGFDSIPIGARMSVAVKGPQPSERAAREIGAVLTGLGFYETVTFSFITPAHAKPFLSPGQSPLSVDDERRKHEGTLRPSVVPSLLACRKKNQDGGVEVEGGVRLYESAAVFSEPAGQPKPAQERRVLSLLLDVNTAKNKPGTIDERQAAIRAARGAVESVIHRLGGGKAEVGFQPAAAPIAAFDPGATAEILLDSRQIGVLGLVSAATQRLFDLAIPVVAAELDLEPLIALYPPRSAASPLPEFPPIQRDLSLIVDEPTPWCRIRETAAAAKPAMLETIEFLGNYRGKPLAAGKKSVTMRLTFRDPNRTLRHDEVDPQIGAVVAAAGRELGAVVRQ